MEYIDIAWDHSNDDYPIRLVSELDEQRNEMRKLEFFRNGTVGFASIKVAKKGTMLSVEPIPPLSEINAQREFVGKLMASEIFEALWVQPIGSEWAGSCVLTSCVIPSAHPGAAIPNT